VSIGDARRQPVRSRKAVEMRSWATDRAISNRHPRIDARYVIPNNSEGTERTGGKRMPDPPLDAAMDSNANPKKRLRRARMKASNVEPIRVHIADVWEELFWFTVIL
jgi:hypothetical protein